MSAAARFDPDDIALLEEERDFLLRSLDDLDRERDDGNLDDDEYRRLHDDYTARAAAVIRSLRDGLDLRPQAPPTPARRRLLAGSLVVGFAVVAAVLLGRALGERLPGQTVTGNEQLADSSGADDDGGTDAMAAADSLLAQGEAAEALRAYDEIAAADPGNAEARVKGAFIVFNAGLVDEAASRLDEAEAVDASYPDTYFIRGIVLFRGRQDIPAAIAAFERYLELAPDGAYAEDARVVLEELTDGTAVSSSTDTEDSSDSPDNRDTEGTP